MNSEEWATQVKRDMDKVAELARAVGEEYARRFKALGDAVANIRVDLRAAAVSGEAKKGK